jgi:hypothetical protein
MSSVAAPRQHAGRSKLGRQSQRFRDDAIARRRLDDVRVPIVEVLGVRPRHGQEPLARGSARSPVLTALGHLPGFCTTTSDALTVVFRDSETGPVVVWPRLNGRTATGGRRCLRA